MKIVGCDLYTRCQQVAMLDEETGELVERRLERGSGEARAFYAGGWPRLRANTERGGPSYARLAKDGAILRADLLGVSATLRGVVHHRFRPVIDFYFSRLLKGMGAITAPRLRFPVEDWNISS